jgi:hypothetical protein
MLLAVLVSVGPMARNATVKLSDLLSNLLFQGRLLLSDSSHLFPLLLGICHLSPAFKEGDITLDVGYISAEVLKTHVKACLQVVELSRL